jgi:hypothetical protein
MAYTPTSPVEEVLYDDEHGLDLLIDGKHNVNLSLAHEGLVVQHYTTRDGKPMEVEFHPTFRTYWILIGNH